MTRPISTVGFLIAAFVVARSESHGSKDGSGSLAYGSATATANAFASARSIASSSDADGNGHDGHKGIRSYDESDYAGNERENGRVQRARGNNGCPKCKWEDDEYWEKDEEEVEEEELEEGRSDTECYDEDDGQYREHVHGYGHGSKGAVPPGVQKLGSETPVGQRPTHGGVANTPSSPGNLVKAAISPWNKMSPAPIGTAYRSDRPANPQHGSHWNSVDSGIASMRKPSWNAGSPGLPNAAAPNQFGAGWSKDPETGSGCSGCVQGSSDAVAAKQGPVPFAGAVQKHGLPDYFPNPTSGDVSHSVPGGVACSGGVYGNCGENSAGRAGSGPGTQVGNRSPEYNPTGQFPASGNGANSGPQPGNPLASGHLTSPYPTTNPSNGVGGSKNTASSGIAYTEGFPHGSPSGVPSPGNVAYPNGHAPRESTERPGQTGVKGNPLAEGRPTTNTYAAKPYHGDNRSGPDSVRHPTFSGTIRDSSPAASSPDRGASDKGDSKIFYINVSPAHGSPVGVKPRGMGTANASYQPQIGSGTGTGNPSYQPKPQGDGATPKPSYQSGPYPGTGTPRSPYQPSTPDGRGANKSFHQPAPSSGNGGWPDSSTNNAHPSTTGNVGSECDSGTNGNGSPDYKACVRNGLPEGLDKSSGPFGGPDTFPNDSSQSSQSVFSKDDGRPSSGGPSAGFGCVGSAVGCTPGASDPTQVEKTKNALPGGGGSYQWNPFLTGKISSPDVGGPGATTTRKPIGQGNVFLEGPQQPGNLAAGAGARDWGQAGVSSVDKRLIGKGNPFLGSPGHSRGDIEIDESTETTRGPADGPETGRNWPIRTASGTPSLRDEGQREAGGGAYGHNSDSNWNAYPAGHAAKNPPATNRGSGSGGGIGFGYDGDGRFAGQSGHGNEGSLSSSDGFTGAFSGSQASSYAGSNSGLHHGSTDSALAVGNGNAGSWSSNGAKAGSQAGSWASSSASAYASSSANSWAGTGPISVKG